MRETEWYGLNIKSRRKVFDFKKLKKKGITSKKCNIMKCMSQYLRIMSLKMRWPWIWATFGIQRQGESITCKHYRLMHWIK